MLHIYFVVSVPLDANPFYLFIICLLYIISIYLFVHLFIYLFIYLFVHLFIYDLIIYYLGM